MRGINKALFALFLIISCSCLFADDNDFYNDSRTYELDGERIIQIEGEISTPLKIDLSNLALHSVIVKEVEYSDDSTRFIGAYKYTGYSLFDILKDVELKKKNAEKFPRKIDLIVIVQNDKGKKVVFSWGEIFYPTVLHRIIIAKFCSPILPKDEKENYPIPKHTKLVCSNDLIPFRNIENPSKITIISSPLPFFVQDKELISHKIDIFDFNGDRVGSIDEIDDTMSMYEYSSVFYGRGRGFHRMSNFSGIPLKYLIGKYFSFDELNLSSGYITVLAIDGYRITLSMNELFNRNDFAEFLLLPHKENRGDYTFSIFPAPDFFSDRAIKYISGIYFMKIGNKR